MDPKTLPNLDPKLKEAYERVMGTSFEAPQPTPPPPTPPIKSAPASQGVPVTLQPISQVVTPVKVTAPPSPPAPSTHHATTFVAGNATMQPKAKISLPILLLGAVVFFLVYALFWLKFFNLPLPF